MGLLRIRQYGDPVLTKKATEVTEIDGKFVKLCQDMFDTMYDAPGIGLAGPQVGVLKRFFVYDFDGEPDVIINPEIVESDGEWTFAEGCLSIPGPHLEVVRPKTILLRCVNLDGDEIEFEADELHARVIQHETDHLDGVLFLDHLSPKMRQQALKTHAERVAELEAIAEGKVIGPDGQIVDQSDGSGIGSL